MIIDRYDQSVCKDYDYCIVGAGPVGLAVALRLADAGQRVLLLEAGGEVPVDDLPGLSHFDIADSFVHSSAAATTRQGLGGASNAWGGGCAPYDPLDFEERPHVPHSGAPVTYADVEPFFRLANEFFGITSATSTRDEDWPHHSRTVQTNRAISYAPTVDMGQRHRTAIKSSNQLTLCLNTRAEDLTLDTGSGKITGLKVMSGGQPVTLSPPVTVIAGGGIQSARLLLLLQRKHPGFLGGEAGPLGRYYMGHLSGSVMSIAFNNPKHARPFLLQQDDHGIFSRRIMTISPGRQRELQLLNTYFAPLNFPLGDPDYKNGAFSAMHLTLALRYGTADYLRYIRPGHISTEFDYGLGLGAHLGTIARSPVSTLSGLAGIAASRCWGHRVPAFQVENPTGVYALRYHAEQSPNPESRVVLSEKMDEFGLPLPRVDLRFGDRDVDSILTSHEVLKTWLEEKNLGSLSWRAPEGRRADHVWSEARDGYHQIGLTRMSRSPRTGVVDSNLAVHGVSNLFIASCGVLPTGSQTHPTFTAVALGLRLADHLTQTVRSSNRVVSQNSDPGRSSELFYAD